LPGDLEAQIEAFVDPATIISVIMSLNNVTPSGVYWMTKAVLQQRKDQPNRKTLETRRLHHSNAPHNQ
jgi:hypothetical protein